MNCPPDSNERILASKQKLMELMEDKPFELKYVSCSSVHVCISLYYIHLVCNELSIHLTGVTQSL